MSQTENDALEENTEKRTPSFEPNIKVLLIILQSPLLTMMPIKDHFDPFN